MSNKTIKDVSEVVDEFYKEFNRPFDIEEYKNGRVAILLQGWIFKTLNQRDQAIKEELLEKVGNMGKYNSADCGQCNNCETMVGTCERHIRDRGHAAALNDIKDIINQVIK